MYVPRVLTYHFTLFPLTSNDVRSGPATSTLVRYGDASHSISTFHPVWFRSTTASVLTVSPVGFVGCGLTT